MALYCSRDVFKALDGLSFPATKHELIEYAERKDAPEAVIVSLDQLDDERMYENISEVCENARVQCHLEVIQVLIGAAFPADREAVIQHARDRNASPSAMSAIEALPSGYTFSGIEDLCSLIV